MTQSNRYLIEFSKNIKKKYFKYLQQTWCSTSNKLKFKKQFILYLGMNLKIVLFLTKLNCCCIFCKIVVFFL